MDESKAKLNKVCGLINSIVSILISWFQYPNYVTYENVPFLSKHMVKYLEVKKHPVCPGQCGSIGWALSCKLKGSRFDSWSGHMPVSRVWSLVGVCARGNQLMFISSFSPPSLLYKTNTRKKKNTHTHHVFNLTLKWFREKCVHVYTEKEREW